jgi:hypothetical protein
MLNDAATEFCSTHVEITSAPGEESVDFSGWSIKEMKVRARVCGCGVRGRG